MKRILTADLLRETLHYDAETGVLTWLVSRGKATVGDVAGAVNSRGYLVVGLYGSLYVAHRLAWMWVYGKWPDSEIDHINCNRSDNRLVNLREATVSQNRANSSLRKKSVSGFKGVDLYKPTGRWRARVAYNKLQHNLGYFATAEEAHAAYLVAATKLHGKYARSS